MNHQPLLRTYCRDPDPLGSVASHPAPASSVPAAAAAARTEAKDEGGAAPTSNDDVTVAPSKAADGDDGTSAAVAASPEMDNRPTKRQRKSESPAANNVDEVDVGEAGNDGGTFGGEDALRAPSFQPNAPISLSTSGGGLMQRAPSFQPNAPISLSTTGGGPIQRTSSFQLNGSVDEGQVWGGGDLSRTLSEGANQVRDIAEYDR